jgi:predicted nucleotidyltransferase component of viral defense system
MIDDAEIWRRASTLGVQQDHVERDYVLNHLLAHVSADSGTLVFRGGTALARVYWPDFRLSEDLDFITPGSGDDIERVERDAVHRARVSTGIELNLEFGPLGGTGHTRSWTGRPALRAPSDAVRAGGRDCPFRRRSIDNRCILVSRW